MSDLRLSRNSVQKLSLTPKSAASEKEKDEEKSEDQRSEICVQGQTGEMTTDKVLAILGGEMPQGSFRHHAFSQVLENSFEYFLCASSHCITLFKSFQY